MNVSIVMEEGCWLMTDSELRLIHAEASIYKTIVEKKLLLSADLEAKRCGDCNCNTKMTFVKTSFEGEQIKLGWFCPVCFIFYRGKAIIMEGEYRDD